MKALFVCLIILGLAPGLVFGQAQYTVLYNFGSVPNDGAYGGASSLVSDRAGNLYGVTSGGGTSGGGIVFELSPNSDGGWTETILYNFCPRSTDCPDGSVPNGLVIDRKGNLYGTTSSGGQSLCPFFGNPCGVAFELSPRSDVGSWAYAVLYNFCSVNSSCDDGNAPFGSLTFDAAGNLYGTTSGGGQQQAGTVFELSPGVGGWSEKVLYSFCSVGGTSCTDGGGPEVGVTFDNSGNLYGTSDGINGGTFYVGSTVYKLSGGVDGWTEAVLFSRPLPKEGFDELGPISLDLEGNVYTTSARYNLGYYTDGDVGRINAKGGVRVFRFNGSDGDAPLSGVLVDQRRKVLYGTTGALFVSAGNIFQIDKSGKETVLYSFCQQNGCPDGFQPGGLLEDQSGHLYGTTLQGGAYDLGVVFELSP